MYSVEMAYSRLENNPTESLIKLTHTSVVGCWEEDKPHTQDFSEKRLNPYRLHQAGYG